MLAGQRRRRLLAAWHLGCSACLPTCLPILAPAAACLPHLVQVGFHNQKAVKKTAVARRINEIVNRLNRTQQERYPDLGGEKEAWLREQRGRQKAEVQAQAKEEREAREEAQRAAEALSYKGFMDEQQMVTAREMGEKYKSVEDYEDDFM